MGLLRGRVEASIVPLKARIDRPVDKRRASHPLWQTAFKLASFLRQPRLADAFEYRLKLGQIRRIVAHRRKGGAGAGDGEGRVEREAGLDCGMRLVQSTKLRKGGAQHEISIWIISVGLDCPPKPRGRLLVALEVEFSHAGGRHPNVN